jgi:hypothetical protein
VDRTYAPARERGHALRAAATPDRPWAQLPAPVGELLGQAIDNPVVLVAIGAVAVLAVALVPALAIPLAWPFLFVVPGWIIVGRVAPTLTAAGRTGVAVITSLFLSAHVTYLIATVAGGYARPPVIATFAVLVGLSLFLAWRWWRVPYDQHFSPATLPEIPRQAFALAGLAFVWVGLTLGLSIWHLTPSGWVSGGWNWSDLLVHVSIANSLDAGNFPPQVPYFSGVPLTYHWFADFHAAITSLIAGVDTIPVMAFTTAIAAGALTLLTWELAWVVLKDRRAAFLAAGIMVFAGGMGWIRLPIDWLNLPDCTSGLADGACRSVAGAVNLALHNPYDNRWNTDWPYFRIPSVMGTGILTHRATALGLPGLVAVVLLVQVSLGKRPAGMLAAGLLAAGLAPFHFFAFPAVYLIVLLQVVAARVWEQPTWRRDALLFLAPALLALPYVLPAFNQVGETGRLQFFPDIRGWGEAPLSDGPLAVLFFYVTNLGVPFLLALLALFSTRVPHAGWLAAWLGAMFLIPNVALFTAVVFDMNKYFQIMWVAVALLAAWLIKDWSIPRLTAVALPSILAPLLVSIWFVGSDWVTLSVSGERAADWIRQNTPERAVFLTEDNINSPVDLSGRLRITTFWAYAANLGYDPGPRSADIKRAVCDGDQAAADVMQSYGASYVLFSGTTGVQCDTDAPRTDFDSSPLFVPVFQQGEVRIWQFVAG